MDAGLIVCCHSLFQLMQHPSLPIAVPTSCSENLIAPRLHLFLRNIAKPDQGTALLCEYSHRRILRQ